MANFVELTVKEVSINAFAAAAEVFASVATNGESSATFGAYFKMDDAGAKYLLVAYNKDSANADETITVYAGNGAQGVKDITLTTLGFGEYTYTCLDSGRFKYVASNGGYCDLAKTIPHNVSGLSEKGCVFISGTSADTTLAVFKLV
jgi:hypothetical protein